jgi:hypothetical protein
MEPVSDPASVQPSVGSPELGAPFHPASAVQAERFLSRLQESSLLSFRRQVLAK